MDSKKHSIATNAPATFSPKEGGRYSAHNNYIKGKNHVDSTFIICLEQKGNDVVLHATHANVPNSEYDSINKGWHGHYWEPRKKYLAGNPISESIKM